MDSERPLLRLLKYSREEIILWFKLSIASTSASLTWEPSSLENRLPPARAMPWREAYMGREEYSRLNPSPVLASVTSPSAPWGIAPKRVRNPAKKEAEPKIGSEFQMLPTGCQRSWIIYVYKYNCVSQLWWDKWEITGNSFCTPTFIRSFYSNLWKEGDLSLITFWYEDTEAWKMSNSPRQNPNK